MLSLTYPITPMARMIVPNVGLGNGAADRWPPIAPWDASRRLWSLRDMLRIYASDYIQLGLRLEAVKQILEEANDVTQNPWGRPLTDDEKKALISILEDIWNECYALSLNVSGALIQNRIVNPPNTAAELNILIEAVHTELDMRLFLFVPPHLAKYHDLTAPDEILSAFPSVAGELKSAGNCIAVGEYTAAVFHAMRAAEIGVRRFAQQLNIAFSFEIALAEWGNVLDQIDAKIREMRNRPRSLEKDSDLQFYSEAASQFRYFKDGWRSRTAHGRATFGELSAQEILEHTISFFLTLAGRLHE